MWTLVENLDLSLLDLKKMIAQTVQWFIMYLESKYFTFNTVMIVFYINQKILH